MSSANAQPASVAADQTPVAVDASQITTAAPTEGTPVVATEGVVVELNQPVKGPDENINVNVDQYPLTPDAWTFYNLKGQLGQYSYRQFVCRQDIVRLARALGRQVTKEELQMLAGLDGDKAVCTATKKEFQPVGFVVFTGRFLQRVAAEKVVNINWAPHAGAFYVKEDRRSEEVFIASGHPYSWNGEREFLAEWSPLVKAREMNDWRWGSTQGEASAIVGGRRDARERQARIEGRINNTVAEFFKGPAGAAAERKLFEPRSKAEQGGRRDRRSVVPTKE